MTNKDQFDQHLDEAARLLLARSDQVGLQDFEREVWAKIVLHDERWTTRLARFFSDGTVSLPIPAVAGSVLVALVAGVFTAHAQAKVYGDSVSDSMEARYIATIHPVLRSASDEHHRHPPAP